MNDGDLLEVKAPDPGFYKDIQSWASKTGNTLTHIEKLDNTIVAQIKKVVVKQKIKAMKLNKT